MASAPLLHPQRQRRRPTRRRLPIPPYFPLHSLHRLFSFPHSHPLLSALSGTPISTGLAYTLNVRTWTPASWGGGPASRPRGGSESALQSRIAWQREQRISCSCRYASTRPHGTRPDINPINPHPHCAPDVIIGRRDHRPYASSRSGRPLPREYLTYVVISRFRR